MLRRAFLALAALATLAGSATASPAAAIRHADRDPSPVFVSSCAVMFGVRSAGSSTTRAGFLGGGTGFMEREDKSIVRIFNLTGYDSTGFQRIADRLCGDVPAELSAAGYQVRTDSAATHFIWADRDSTGQTSPQDQKLAQTRYVVYARAGAPILDPWIVGGMKGPKLQDWETTVARQYGLRPVRVLYFVDFATIEASKGKRFIGLNVAEVSSTLQVTVGASVSSYDAASAKCSRGAPFGKHKTREFCSMRGNSAFQQGQYQLPDDDERAFRDPVVSVDEVTSGAQKFVDGLSAVLPRRNKTVSDTKEFNVAVDMSRYEARVIEGAAGVLTKVMAAIDDPSKRKNEKR